VTLEQLRKAQQLDLEYTALKQAQEGTNKDGVRVYLMVRADAWGDHLVFVPLVTARLLINELMGDVAAGLRELGVEMWEAVEP
jgi:hypothetical protein